MSLRDFYLVTQTLRPSFFTVLSLGHSAWSIHEETHTSGSEHKLNLFVCPSLTPLIANLLQPKQIQPLTSTNCRLPAQSNLQCRPPPLILLLYNQCSASSEASKQPLCNYYPAVINILTHCACVKTDMKEGWRES